MVLLGSSLFSKPEFQLDRQYVSKAAIRLRFLLSAVVNLLLVFPTLLLSLTSFLLQYLASLKHASLFSSSAYKWSLLHYICFQHANELPHFYKSRMATAAELLTRYQATCPPTVSNLFAGFVVQVCGYLVAVLVGLTLYDDQLAFFVEFKGKNLIFYMALLGVAIAMLSSVNSKADNDQLTANQSKNGLKSEVCASCRSESHCYTAPTGTSLLQSLHSTLGAGYIPASYHQAPVSSSTQRHLSSLYQHRFVILGQELLSTLFTWFYLARLGLSQAEAISDFFVASTREVPGVGAVCALSDFRERAQGQERDGQDWEGKLRTSVTDFQKTYMEGQMEERPDSPDCK